jgi:hypothetical protein
MDIHVACKYFGNGLECGKGCLFEILWNIQEEKKLAITADAKTLIHSIAASQKSYLRLADLAMDVIPGHTDPHLATVSCQTHPRCNVDEARWRHWLG